VVVYVNLVAMENGAALSGLDIGYLALFCGQRMNDVVLAKVHGAGFAGVRMSHGYVIQHLVESDRSITELSKRMGVSQQAASKVVAELSSLGYLEDAPSDDARVRRVRLSARGRAMLAETRRLRAELERSLLRKLSPAAVRETRAVLTKMIERLGADEPIRRRAVPEPR
jgi:DNA-binding MarR family transcriptional regulator